MIFEKKSAWYRKLFSYVKARAGNGPTVLDPFEAYQLWAKTYDNRQGNALLYAEHRIIYPLLERLSLSGKSVLDAGCGTGRYIEELRLFKPSSIAGIDFAPKMIERGMNKFRNDASISFQVASMNSLPFRDQSFDFVISTLALDHLQNLQDGVSELSRVLRRQGSMIISVFHPFGQLLGWQRTFAKKNGHSREFAVKYCGHRHQDYFDAFQACGLNICQMFEPIIDESLEPFYNQAGRLDLFKQYKGHPLLLIFHLEKS